MISAIFKMYDPWTVNLIFLRKQYLQETKKYCSVTITFITIITIIIIYFSMQCILNVKLSFTQELRKEVDFNNICVAVYTFLLRFTESLNYFHHFFLRR